MFIPFMFFTVLPILALPITSRYIIDFQSDIDQEVPISLVVAHIILLLMLSIASLRLLYYELKEVKVIGPAEYIFNFQNYLQFGLVFTTIQTAIYAYNMTVQFVQERDVRDSLIAYENDTTSVRDAEWTTGKDAAQLAFNAQVEESQQNLASLINVTIISTLFLVSELPQQLRIFDFFSVFVRELQEIIKDSAAIGALLFLVIFMQTFIIYILDNGQNYDSTF